MILRLVFQTLATSWWSWVFFGQASGARLGRRP
uniref:Uncharacterized protein n=1 Tax=Arundo donax TaxID=35708 RepID=A0A0A8YEB3_ARUDO